VPAAGDFLFAGVRALGAVGLAADLAFAVAAVFGAVFAVAAVFPFGFSVAALADLFFAFAAFFLFKIAIILRHS